MSDYLQPGRGDWVSFHPSTPGPAAIGQVAAEAAPNRWGRACYRVAFRVERKAGKNLFVEHTDDVISADRLIAITRRPRNVTPLIHDDEQPQEKT